jgi:hypothetical protein
MGRRPEGPLPGNRPTRSRQQSRGTRGPRAIHLSGLTRTNVSRRHRTTGPILIPKGSDQDRNRSHLMHLRVHAIRGDELLHGRPVALARGRQEKGWPRGSTTGTGATSPRAAADLPPSDARPPADIELGGSPYGSIRRVGRPCAGALLGGPLPHCTVPPGRADGAPRLGSKVDDGGHDRDLPGLANAPNAVLEAYSGRSRLRSRATASRSLVRGDTPRTHVTPEPREVTRPVRTAAGSHRHGLTLG